MKEILLNHNCKALIDDEDFFRVSQFKWRALKRKDVLVIYVGHDFIIDGKLKQVRLHNFLIGQPLMGCIDHINGNGLDNRKENLRFVTKSQNCMNTRKRAICASKYKGIQYDKKQKLYKARIMVNGKRKYLGGSKNEKEAAKKYNEAAIKYFGEFAVINEI